jgi:hypothetical protein
VVQPSVLVPGASTHDGIPPPNRKYELHKFEFPVTFLNILKIAERRKLNYFIEFIRLLMPLEICHLKWLHCSPLLTELSHCLCSVSTVA